MAYEDLIGNRSILSATNFQSPRTQFVFVKLNSSGQLVVCGNGGIAIGVLEDTPAVGDAGAVCRPGDISKVLCGGTIAAGGAVMSNAAGLAVAAVSGGNILGYALGAGALNFITSIIFMPCGIQP